MNVLHERALFYSRAQLPDENIETYIRKLYELSKHAHFPNREESIQDRLVLGMCDRELSEKLQLKANLVLKDAVQQAHQFQLVKHQLSEQRYDSSTSVDAVTHRPSGSSAPQQATTDQEVGPGPRNLTTIRTKGEMTTEHAPTVDTITTEGPRVQLRGRNVGPVENPTTLNKYAALQRKSTMSQ